MCVYLTAIEHIVDFYDVQQGTSLFNLNRPSLTSQNLSCEHSYHAIRRWCETVVNQHHIDGDFCILLAHAVYGWMPTMLTINPNGKGEDAFYQNAKGIAQKLQNGSFNWGNIQQQPEDFRENLARLSCFLNNSYVGVSKFLHFLYPDQYAIFDSRIRLAFNYSEKITPETTARRNARGAINSPAVGQTAFIDYQISIRTYRNNHTQAGNLRDIELKLYTVGQWLCRQN